MTTSARDPQTPRVRAWICAVPLKVLFPFIRMDSWSLEESVLQPARDRADRGTTKFMSAPSSCLSFEKKLDFRRPIRANQVRPLTHVFSSRVLKGEMLG